MKKVIILIYLFFIVLTFNTLMAQTELDEPIEQASTLEVTIPKGTEFETMLTSEINTSRSEPGDQLEFKLLKNYIVDEQVILYRNSYFTGKIVDIYKENLLDESYEIVVDIDKISLPFKGDYAIDAHPIFETKKHKKKKGRRFKLGYGYRSEDLLDNYGKDHPKESKEEPTIIKSGSKIKVVLDQDFTLKLEIKE